MQFSFVELEQARLHNIGALSGTLGVQHKGTIGILTSDNLPYYWNGTIWKTLANSFLELSDVDPSSYTGQEGRFLHVDSTPDAIKFSDRMYTYGSNAYIEMVWLSGDGLPTLFVGSSNASNNQNAIVATSRTASAALLTNYGTGNSAGTYTLEVNNAGGSSGSTSIKATGQGDFSPVIDVSSSAANGYGVKSSGSSRGVWAISTNSTGVYADGNTYGVYAIASGASARGLSANANGASAIAVEGVGGARGGSFTGTSFGVHSSTSGANSTAVYAANSGATGTTYGVQVQQSGSPTNAYGVYAVVSGGTFRYAFYGESAQVGGTFKTTGTGTYAVYADASTLASTALLARSAGNTASFPTVYVENTAAPTNPNAAYGLHVKMTGAKNTASTGIYIENTATSDSSNLAYALYATSRNNTAYFTSNPSASSNAGVVVEIVQAVTTSVSSYALKISNTGTDNSSNNAMGLHCTARNDVSHFEATTGASGTAAVNAQHVSGYAFYARITGTGTAFQYDYTQDGSPTGTRGIFLKNSNSSSPTAEITNSSTTGTAMILSGGASTNGVGLKVSAGELGIWSVTRVRFDARANFTAGGYTAANGNNDNINIPDAVFIRVTGPTAGFNIRGITNVSDGRFIILANRSGQVMTVNNQDAGSTAANRIITGTGANIAFAVDTSVCLVYDNTTQRWLVIT